MKNTLWAFAFATAAATTAIVLPAAADDSPGPGEPTLAEVRTLTEKYQDVKVALAEGFIRDPSNMCETADMMGRPAASNICITREVPERGRPETIRNSCAATSL